MSNDVKRLFAFGCPTLEAFEDTSKRAKELGATHILITENLPPAMWQYEETGDPYTAWFVNNPSLLKLFTPDKVKPLSMSSTPKKFSPFLNNAAKFCVSSDLRHA